MLTRRQFLQLTTLSAAAAIAACATPTHPITPSPLSPTIPEKPMTPLHIYVGAYTKDLGWINGQAKGVALYQLDPATGKLSLLSEAASDNPSYLTQHPSGKFLYATNEGTDFGPTHDNSISAFAVAADGSLTLLNRVAALGGAPCYVSVEPTGKYALTANYSGGNFVVYPLGEDGSLAEASDNSKHTGSGPDKKRQEGPHAHSINVSPDGQFALGCDLGLDKIFVSKIDLASGKLIPHSEGVVAGGSGPRHLDFHPNGKFAYVINEMGGTMTDFAWDGAAGTLTEIQTISTVPDGYTGQKWCADVHVHPSGKFVYGSNRTHDSIVIYRVDDATGKLTLVGHEPTQGKTPRNFAISPAGDLLLAANQDSSNIVVFQIDLATGKLTHLATNDIPTPVCIKFAL
jgi:6-phosphogluconolactonase